MAFFVPGRGVLPRSAARSWTILGIWIGEYPDLPRGLNGGVLRNPVSEWPHYDAGEPL